MDRKDMAKLSMEYTQVLNACVEQIEAIYTPIKDEDFRKTVTGVYFLAMHPELEK